MNQINGINGLGQIGRIQPSIFQKPSIPQVSQTSGSTDDTVEISNVGSFMSKIAEMPDVRQDKIDQVKAEIASGTYMTQEKFDIALERMLAEL